jgi:hypothetical protein
MQGHRDRWLDEIINGVAVGSQILIDSTAVGRCQINHPSCAGVVSLASSSAGANQAG